MNVFINYKLRRNLLFEYISSIELDLRQFILKNNVNIEQFFAKAKKRVDEHGLDDSIQNLLMYLDFGDYVEIINNNFKNNGLNDLDHKKIVQNLKSLTPIRNKVVHSRPISHEDDEIVLKFVRNRNKFSSIIVFQNLENSVVLIDKNPNVFYEKTPNFDLLFIHNSIENNLPMADYDDTGFIGREEKKADIKRKLYGRYPIITIIGDGGIGKTSIVLSLISDLIDEESFPFEKVLWTSLKTKSLVDGEFKILKNTVKSFDECIRNNQILDKEKVTAIDDLLFYMNAFKTLLILDNLETINTNDVRRLFEEVPDGSKILVTSRIGIGEFETRISLEPFDKNESRVYFRRLSDAYSVDVLKNIPDKDVDKYTEKLYHSPLCIKWFIINVGKGNNPDVVVKNQNEIVEYCLSNVFEKLSESAKSVLTLMMIKHKDFAMAEIVYIYDQGYESAATAVNELCACNFLQQIDRGVYSIPDFARKYLSLKINKRDSKFEEYLSRSNKLDGIIENLYMNDRITIKNKPLSLDPKTSSEKVSTIYMLNFIDSSNKQDIDAMDDWFDKATKASPSFSDLYKVAGYCYAKNKSNDKAKECFEIALSQANNDNIPYIESIYSIFLNNQIGNYDEAKKHIKIALSYQPDNEYFRANYARVLKYEKNFKESEEIIADLLKPNNQLDDGFRAKMISEYIDLRFRIIDEDSSNSTVKINKLEKLISYIDSVHPDFYTFGFYKGLRKIYDLLVRFSNNDEFKRLGKLFCKKYFKYVFIFEKTNSDQIRFIERTNESFLMSYDINTLNLKFDVFEYGYLKSINEDFHYGSIKGKNTRYFTFSFYNLDFDYRSLRIDCVLRFVPCFYKLKWRATEVCIPSLIKEDE